MAKRRSGPQQVSEAVREAVERTVHATVGSAQVTRGRAQEAVDDVVRVGERVREALEERRPATQEDLKRLHAELRAIGRRLDAIEARLPAQPKPRAGGAKRAGSKKRSSP